MDEVSEIILPELLFDNYLDKHKEVLKILQPISKVNIFVGPNNSGKSRILRLLARQPFFSVSNSKINLSLINKRIYELLALINILLTNNGFTSVNDTSLSEISTLQQLPMELSEQQDVYIYIRAASNKWVHYSKIESHSRNRAGEISTLRSNELITQINTIGKEIQDLLAHVPARKNQTRKDSVYIPVLRGLRPIQNSFDDIFSMQVANDYFPQDDFLKLPNVFTGLSLYSSLIEMLLGNNDNRKMISDYQAFLSEIIFDGKQISLIPKIQEKRIDVKIGIEKEFPIYHLGDGIQSVLILTFLPFILQTPTFFFIEEPELFLHPGLQRKILTFFSSFDRHQFFMTTHSNHFLDLTMDFKNVSIFTIRKQLPINPEEKEITPNFVVEAVDSGDRSSLELLGVRNSSVFLVNATIWVEGITDRMYFRKILYLYIENLRLSQKKFINIQEDVHFSFVEYGGANISHWSFLDDEEKPIEIETLCSKAFVIIDGDGNAKLERKKKLSDYLEDRLEILPCREVENLLPYKTIKEVVLEYEKDPNKVIPEYNFVDYKNEYLGNFIEDRMLQNKVKRVGGYKDKSGTIKAKTDFCDKACQKLTFEDLPDETKRVIRKIYNFIVSQNQ